MEIILSQLKDYEQAKVKVVMDICLLDCHVDDCPNKHIRTNKRVEFGKKSFFNFFFKKDKCKTKEQLTETFPFIPEDTIRERIFALGIIPGAKIKMIGQSPLKDPIIIDLSGHLVSLRKAEADLIIVETQD